MEAKEAVLQTIRELIKEGQRPHLHNVPFRAEKLLIEFGKGRIDTATAQKWVWEATVLLKEEGKIAAPEEPWNDWRIIDGPTLEPEAKSPRIMQWEKYGVEAIKADLVNGGYRFVGGTPEVREEAWAWVRKMEVRQMDQHLGSKTAQGRAFDLLKAINDHSPSSERPAFVTDLAPSLRMSENEVRVAWQYLKDKGLIKTYSIDYTATINAHGIDALAEREDQQSNVAVPTPTTVNNTTYNIGNMHHSAIQNDIGGDASVKTQAATNKAWWSRGDVIALLTLVVTAIGVYIAYQTLHEPASPAQQVGSTSQ